MAAPNIVNVTTITGKTATVALTTTASTLILNNAAASGKVLKVNSLYVANVDGTNGVDVTISIFAEDDIGGTGYPIASTINVPADSTVVVIDKESAIYIEEDKSIGALASAPSDLTVVASYEEIS